jgi:hypothetical protein
MAHTTPDLEIERLSMNIVLPSNAGQICQYCAIQALNDLNTRPNHAKISWSSRPVLQFDQSLQSNETHIDQYEIFSDIVLPFTMSGALAALILALLLML